MSTHRVLALVATLALAPAGCEYFASPDPLAPDPDAIFVTIVLVAGETGAHMLVGHPHRAASDPPPKVSASLIGPGWRAALTHKTDPKDGCGGGPTYWPIPMVCLNATLPEPIRERATYRLEGEGPMGPFTGETAVPPAPVILDPVDTLWVRDTTYLIRIPIRYRAPREVGILRPEAYGTVVVPSGTRSKWIPVWPISLDLDGQTDTVQLLATPSKAFLRLLGIGWNYTRFRAGTGHFRFPWPNFGISGKGVYGYFDGSAPSRPVHIVVDVPPGRLARDSVKSGVLNDTTESAIGGIVEESGWLRVERNDLLGRVAQDSMYIDVQDNASCPEPGSGGGGGDDPGGDDNPLAGPPPSPPGDTE